MRLKKAITLVEIIVAMSVLTALSLLALPALRQNTPDNEVNKFRHVYGTISTVVSYLVEDKALYPDNSGFANTDFITIRATGAQYGGATKFRNVFKEKFNILEDKVVLNESNIPIYSTKPVAGGAETVTYANSVECFTNNTGVLFCPPETPINDGVTMLKDIYLRVHVNDKHEIDHAVYFKIAADGKIEFPYKIEGKFNCTEAQYNKYSHCRIVSALDDL